MSLMNRVARFARSPQGQRAVGKAKSYAPVSYTHLTLPTTPYV